MKKHITTINTKYIHENNILSIFKMYVNSSSSSYNIKQSNMEIANDLLSYDADEYYFSIYIWNIKKSNEIIKLLKKHKPNIKIIYGGPEVSFNPLDVIKENESLDYIFCGEINESINVLQNNPYVVSKHSTSFQVNFNHTMHKLDYLNEVDTSEYKILYIETSKGCPFKCSYCMSSLEKKLVTYNDEDLEIITKFIAKSPAKTIKFLDRTFNVSDERTISIINTLSTIKNKVFQFEISPEMISESQLDFFKQIESNNIRFEVGIQSIYEDTTKAVERYMLYQNYYKILEELVKTNIVMHLDLIAGLPYETIEKFKNSFNEVIKLKPDEFQLGVLKLLHGTSLRLNHQNYDYKFSKNPPYEIICNAYLSEKDLKTIHCVEEITDRFYNSKKLRKTFETIIDTSHNTFDIFLHIYNYLEDKKFNFIGYQNFDFFKIIYNYMSEFHPRYKDYVILDYMTINVNRQKRFYKTIKKQSRNILYNIYFKNIEQNYFHKYFWIELVRINETSFIIAKDIKTTRIIKKRLIKRF